MPTPSETLTIALALLSPRARSGLLALDPDVRARIAHAVATEQHLESWDRYLSAGQPWPDVIEGES